MGRRCFCGCSNAVVVLLNAGMMMVALVILGLWLTTASRVSSACDKFLQMPLLILGLALLVVSFVGLVGACCRAPCLLWLYLATTFFFIIGVCCFTVFAFVVSNKSAAAAVSSRGVGELRLGDYSGWLRRTISDGGNWEKIQSCLKQGRVCGGPLQGLPVNPSAFYKTALSPIQASFFFLSLFFLHRYLTIFLFVLRRRRGAATRRRSAAGRASTGRRTFYPPATARGGETIRRISASRAIHAKPACWRTFSWSGSPSPSSMSPSSSLSSSSISSAAAPSAVAAKTGTTATAQAHDHAQLELPPLWRLDEFALREMYPQP